MRKSLVRFAAILTAALLCSGCAPDLLTPTVQERTVPLPDGGLDAFLGLTDNLLIDTADVDLDGDGVSDHVELRDGGTYGVSTLLLFVNTGGVLRWYAAYVIPDPESVGRLSCAVENHELVLRCTRAEEDKPVVTDYPIRVTSGELYITCADEFIRLEGSTGSSAGRTAGEPTAAPPASDSNP